MYANKSTSYCALTLFGTAGLACSAWLTVVLALFCLAGAVHAQSGSGLQPPALAASAPSAANVPSNGGDMANGLAPWDMSDAARMEFLRKTALAIATLRQQQALVEAQVKLAKAKADLANAGKPPQAVAAPVRTVVSTSAESADAKPLRITPVSMLRLVGVMGIPSNRMATVSLGDSQRVVEAGSVIAGWRVKSVGLDALLLEPVSGGSGTAVLNLETELLPLSNAPSASKAPGKPKTGTMPSKESQSRG